MPRDPRAYLQRAEEHRRHGRLKEAIALSIEALGKHPGLDAVRVTLGRAYLENAQPEEARATLLEVFGRLPEHHLAGKLLIESQRLLGDLGGAETTCRTLLEHYPRDREIEPLLAEIVRARSSSVVAEAPVAPAATPGARPAAVPAAAAGPAAVAPPRVASSPAVEMQERDPEPEYFPEDIASAPGSPIPPPAAARSAAMPAKSAPSPVSAVPIAPAPPKVMAPPPTAAATAPPAPAAAPPGPMSMAPPASPAKSPQAPAVVAKPAATPSAASPSTASAKSVASVSSATSAAKDALGTNTLAELYVKQGLPDRAIEVYRSMLRVEPGNIAARKRLAELESVAAPAAPRTEKAESADRARATSPKNPATAVQAASIPVPVEASIPTSAPPRGPAETVGRAGAARDRGAIEQLERWLAAVKRGQDRQGGGAAA